MQPTAAGLRAMQPEVAHFEGGGEEAAEAVQYTLILGYVKEEGKWEKRRLPKGREGKGVDVQCDERKSLVRALERAFSAVRRDEGAAVAEVVAGHENEGGEPARYGLVW